MSSRPVPHHRSPEQSLADSGPGRDSIALLNAAIRRHLKPPHLSAVGGSDPCALTLFGVTHCGSKRLRSGTDRVADTVLGFIVPESFEGVVAVAEAVVTTRASQFRSARLAVGVWRDGTETGVICADGDEMTASQPRGWLIDACRRSLGLATSPTRARSIALPVAIWLDRLMVQLVQTGEPLEWAEAVESCPVPSDLRSIYPAELGQAIAASTPGWSALRRAAAGGASIPVPIEPGHADWMDNPMFARWCLGFFPDVDELRADLEFLAPTQVAVNVEACIGAASLASR